MKKNTDNIFIVAGESSGDMHAASLIKEIKTLKRDISFSGIGGPRMLLEKVDLLYDISQVNFIGFSSVIRNIKKIKSILDNCILQVKKTDPLAVILVDYPGFNLKLITGIRKFYKGKIIYYISPQLWAWHKSRINIIKKYVDLMIVVFPFEVDFYDKEDIKAEYAGHPLVKRIDSFLSGTKKSVSDKINISILPGSRKDEIDRMLPVLVKTADLFDKDFDCTVNFICSTNFDISYYKKFIKNKKYNIVHDKEDSDLNYKTILNSDLVITKSGTSTMECALIGTPFCVVYKTGELNYSIGKRLVKVDHIAMVNILLGKRAVKEFLQNEMTPENIYEEGKKILTDKIYTAGMKKDFSLLRSILSDKDASANAAGIIVKFINSDKN
ncbi:MAG TPA: lipid-A-disaccharide synthase [Ignavibacteria bacterium]|nr:lipid-A-disaccharide synthase [Ignavibacteria bacterium]